MYPEYDELKKVNRIVLSTNNRGKPIKYITAAVLENKFLSGDAIKIYGCLLLLGSKSECISIDIVSNYSRIMIREAVEALTALKVCRYVYWEEDILYVGNKTYPPLKNKPYAPLSNH